MVSKSELIYLFLECLHNFFKVLHTLTVLLYRTLHGFEIHVELHLHGCEVFPDHVGDHPSCDLIELFFEVRSFEFGHADLHLFHLVVAVFDDIVLALFHLLDGLDVRLDLQYDFVLSNHQAMLLQFGINSIFLL